MTKVAVVILNWNGQDFLEKFLPGVIENSSGEGTEIVVVDNGSTDGSLEVLKKLQPAIRVIGLDSNHGFAPGYAKALRMIDATYFLLLNSDVEVTPGWLTSLVSLMDSDSSIAACMPKIRSFSQRQFFEYAGAAGGFIDLFGYPFCRGRILSSIEKDTGQYDADAELFWASGACMLVRASAYYEAGELDSDFFAHMEEIDLCWRLKNQGWQIKSEPRSIVFHQGGATLSYHSPKKVYLNFRNSLWMMIKNLPQNQLFSRLFPRLILDGVAALHFLLTGQWKAFRAVVSAHISFYGTLPGFLRKRAELIKLVRQNNHPEMFRGSMVYRFYLLKYRKFSRFRF